MTIKLALPIAAVALAGALMTGPAQARSDVHWSVQIALPIPLPLLPIVVPRHHDYYAAPVYAEPVWRDHRYSSPGWRDRDHDGIPNRYDRYDNRRYAPVARVDRDRDGIPDHRDHYDNRRDWPHHWHDRGRDGLADWRDRRDHRR